MNVAHRHCLSLGAVGREWVDAAYILSDWVETGQDLHRQLSGSGGGGHGNGGSARRVLRPRWAPRISLSRTPPPQRSRLNLTLHHVTKFQSTHAHKWLQYYIIDTAHWPLRRLQTEQCHSLICCHLRETSDSNYVVRKWVSILHIEMLQIWFGIELLLDFWIVSRS
jgi:hypothetical protein